METAEIDCLKSYRPLIAETLGNGINQILSSSNNGMDLPLEVLSLSHSLKPICSRRPHGLIQVSTILFCAASHVYEPLVVSTCEAWVNQCRNAIVTSSWTTNTLGAPARQPPPLLSPFSLALSSHHEIHHLNRCLSQVSEQAHQPLSLSSHPCWSDTELPALQRFDNKLFLILGM
jgi:hypothetical protein